MRHLRFATLVASFVAVLATGTSTGTAAPTELFFSEYIEGSSNNKALEIYNGTGAAVDLATGAYNVQMFFNGSSSALVTINLTGTVAGGDVYVLAQALANATILAQADQTSTASWYNGDDAVVLRKGTTVIDAIGQIGFDPGTEWGTGSTSTADNTLTRKQAIEAGDPDGSNAFDPAVEWDGFAQDTFAGLGSHTQITPTAARIREIQGAGHRSPLTGMAVIGVGGIVTAKSGNGFWMQDPDPDASDATSEGLFVFTSSAPAVNVGDAISVMGSVAEFRPGGSTSANLTTTELTGPTVAVLSTGNALPAATVLGSGGRTPPLTVIENDATGDVETSGVFDPANDGIDFYESLEGMRVQVDDAQAVGPTNGFGEIPVVGDFGSIFTPRGGLILRQADANPERIILDDVIVGAAAMPSVNVGDGFTEDVVGVLDYSFGNFKLLVSEAPTVDSSDLRRETTTAATAGQLAVASFNVENLDPTDSPAKFAELAGLIVNNLKSPDLIAIEEVQDNNGATNDGTVAADASWNALIAAITAAGGPTYQFRQVDPANNQDGGEPGGNIRQGFLLHTDRGLSFVDAPGATATEANSVVAGPHLELSPGRIDPTSPAFTSSRKPLAGEFRFHGQTLFVIGNHFNSKGGDHPLFGRFQPPVLASEPQRVQQAQVVNDFVDAILEEDANANVIVLGDLNDFDWSTPLVTLKGSVLTNLYSRLPENERYSYVFDGNSQALDHILISSNLQGKVRSFDPVHVNAEFAVQASDHDPLVARFCVEERRRACP